jgi:hypothetical protein
MPSLALSEHGMRKLEQIYNRIDGDCVRVDEVLTPGSKSYRVDDRKEE